MPHNYLEYGRELAARICSGCMIALVITVLAVFLGSSLLRVYSATRGLALPPAWLPNVSIALGALVSLIFHEGGHRTAGAIMGWRCVRFGFGPFEFYREGKVWKKCRVKMLWGAFVRQLPPSFTHFRAQKSITLLSGPLSSLVFGSAILAIAATTNSGSVLELFSKVGLITFLGVLELIPSCRNGIGSDGYRLREVLGGGEPLDEMYREMLAETSNFTAVRYRDWPREALMRLAASGDPYNVYLAYLHMLDAGDLETAAAYMRRLIALLPEQEPYPHYAAEAAYWLAVYGCDSDAARKWLECTGPSLDEAARLQAEAAVAWAEGRSEYAAGLVKQGLALAAALEECGFVACYVDQMKAILNAAPVAHGIKLVEA